MSFRSISTKPDQRASFLAGGSLILSSLLSTGYLCVAEPFRVVITVELQELEDTNDTSTSTWSSQMYDARVPSSHTLTHFLIMVDLIRSGVAGTLPIHVFPNQPQS